MRLRNGGIATTAAGRTSWSASGVPQMLACRTMSGSSTSATACGSCSQPLRLDGCSQHPRPLVPQARQLIVCTACLQVVSGLLRGRQSAGPFVSRSRGRRRLVGHRGRPVPRAGFVQLLDPAAGLPDVAPGVLLPPSTKPHCGVPQRMTRSVGFTLAQCTQVPQAIRQSCSLDGGLSMHGFKHAIAIGRC